MKEKEEDLFEDENQNNIDNLIENQIVETWPSYQEFQKERRGDALNFGDW